MIFFKCQTCRTSKCTDFDYVKQHGLIATSISEPVIFPGKLCLSGKSTVNPSEHCIITQLAPP